MLPKKDATKFMSECACLLLLLSHYPENISNRLEKQGRVKSPQLSQLRLYYIGGKSENISRRGRSPGEGHGNPHQYSCLQNPMDTEAWWAYTETKSVTHLVKWFARGWEAKAFQVGFLIPRWAELFPLAGFLKLFHKSLIEYWCPWDRWVGENGVGVEWELLGTSGCAENLFWAWLCVVSFILHYYSDRKLRFREVICS